MRKRLNARSRAPNNCPGTTAISSTGTIFKPPALWSPGSFLRWIAETWPPACGPLNKAASAFPASRCYPGTLWQGIRDHIQLLSDPSQDPSIPGEARRAIRDLAAFAEPLEDDASSWIGALPWLEEQIQRIEEHVRQYAPGILPGDGAYPVPDLAWWAGETAARLRGSALWSKTSFLGRSRSILSLFPRGAPIERITLASLPAALRDVENQLAESLNNHQTSATERSAARLLQRRLPSSVENAARLAQALQRHRP